VPLSGGIRGFPSLRLYGIDHQLRSYSKSTGLGEAYHSQSGAGVLRPVIRNLATTKKHLPCPIHLLYVINRQGWLNDDPASRRRKLAAEAGTGYTYYINP